MQRWINIMNCMLSHTAITSLAQNNKCGRASCTLMNNIIILPLYQKSFPRQVVRNGKHYIPLHGTGSCKQRQSPAALSCDKGEMRPVSPPMDPKVVFMTTCLKPIENPQSQRNQRNNQNMNSPFLSIWLTFRGYIFLELLGSKTNYVPLFSSSNFPLFFNIY